jgi:hypothetical protein
LQLKNVYDESFAKKTEQGIDHGRISKIMGDLIIENKRANDMAGMWTILCQMKLSCIR